MSHDMVSPSQQLHTAARRYALNAHARWAALYTESGASTRPKSAKGRGIFPRYLVHQAMLWALEAEDVPEELPVAREMLASTILHAHSFMTNNLRGSIEIKAMDEERHALEAFIRSVSEADLTHVELLPYRRVLSAHERQQAEQGIQQVWGIDVGYWFPLDDARRSDVIAFEASPFHRDVGSERLRSILRELGTGHVFELPEFNEYPAFEQDLDACDFRYTGAEGYWFDGGFEWIIYASHEDSVTLGGTPLIEGVQLRWPAWSRHLWSSGSISVEPPAT